MADKLLRWTDVEHERQLLWERYIPLRENEGSLSVEELRRLNEIRDKYDELSNSVLPSDGCVTIEERWHEAMIYWERQDEE